MDNRQQARLDSFDRIDALSNNDKYKATLTGIEGYPQELEKLQAAIATINSGGIVQTGADSPDEETVLAVKTLMGKTVHKYCLRGMVRASQVKNTSLTHALDEPETYITSASKADAVLRAKALRNTMNDNLAILTNIKPEDILTMDKAIDSYDNMKEDPIANLKERKATGTDVIPKAERNGKEAVDNMYALVKSYLEDEDPELVNLFALDMEVINTAIRHTTVEITALAEEDNEPIEGADILDVKTEKHFATDDEGLAELGKHLNGDDTFVISAPGRQTVTVGFKIISRKDNAFVVKLKKMV